MSDIGDPLRIEKHYPIGFPEDAPAAPESDPMTIPEREPTPADTVTTGDISNTVVMMIVDQEV
jgi:hypothetical protein